MRTAKVFDVGRSRVDIARAFVEAHVNGILDTAGFEVAPEHILRGVGGTSEKDASFCVEGELGRTFSRGTDPDAATEGSKIGEVLLVFSTS